MNEPRDTLVGDALRRLDVPDHAPDFWDRLDASLSGASLDDDDLDERPDVEADGEVIELATARSNRRAGPVRSARLPVAAAAAAAVAAVVLAIGLPAAQQAADGESQVDSATVPEGDPVPDPGTALTPDTTITDDTPAVQPAPEVLVTDWLTLLRDGEVEPAYALLDETSQQTLSLDAFRDVATGLAEGAGSFADLQPSAIPLIDDEGLAATAVVFTGDVQREGKIETASYAVVVTGDPADASRRLGVAFTLDGPTVEAVQRTQPSETRTSPLEIDLSPTAGASWAIADGSTVERIGTGSPTVVVDVEAIAGPGTHTIVVVSTEAGLYTARSFTVVVP